MECKICHKEIEHGKRFKGERFKSEAFCSEECYNERVRLSEERKVKRHKTSTEPCESSQQPVEGKQAQKTERRQLTDLIKKIYGDEVNFPLFMTQIKKIEQDFDVTDQELRLTIKYAFRYANCEFNSSFGIYQFIGYIKPMREFREQLAKSREVELEEDGVVYVKKCKQKKRIWRER